jgi:hypothetical protein
MNQNEYLKLLIEGAQKNANVANISKTYTAPAGVDNIIKHSTSTDGLSDIINMAKNGFGGEPEKPATPTVPKGNDAQETTKTDEKIVSDDTKVVKTEIKESLFTEEENEIMAKIIKEMEEIEKETDLDNDLFEGEDDYSEESIALGDDFITEEEDIFNDFDVELDAYIDELEV